MKAQRLDGKANMPMDEKMRECITDENQASGTGPIGACLESKQTGYKSQAVLILIIGVI